MRDFRKLDIWKGGVDLSVEIYGLAAQFPKHERYGLFSQVTRAAVSIPSNIAEGCRGSNKELIHYLNIALGSAFELETQLIIATRIGYIESDTFKKVLVKINTLQRRMNSFKTAIKS